MRCFVLVLFSLTGFGALQAQPKTDSFLYNLLQAAPGAVLHNVLNDPQAFRLQIIYTQLNRDRHNNPSFTHYYFNYDSLFYFYPASVVKLPLALLSLEKLNSLHKKGVTKFTTVQFDSSYAGQKPLLRDSSSETGLPSIAHFIRRAFLISENDPYNRMYQFVGQQAINRSLHRKGYTGARIVRQFMGFNEDQNRHTNGVRFLKRNGSVLYYQPPAYNTDSFDYSHDVKIGTAYYNRADSLVHEPFDFTRHNFLSLQTLQQLLQSTMFPASVPKRQRFALSKKDYNFLYKYLSQYPSETPFPKYDTSLFYDSYVKFFFLDNTHRMPPQVRVFNKVGWAYGTLTDVSYVADFAHHTEYMLSATIYVNSDGVLNDDTYEFESVGLPFLAQLGQAIYQYEQTRPRKYKPDLSRFRIRYEHRDAQDKRPAIKEADN